MRSASVAPKGVRISISRNRSLAAIAVVLLLAGAGPTEASLQQAIRQLEKGKPEAALSTLTNLLDRVGPSVAPGRENMESLGAVLLYRAVAEYQLERLRDARWSWRMALIFFPDLATMDISSLGPAGDFLRGQAVGEPEIVLDAATQPRDLPADLTAPEKIRSPAPAYGVGARASGLQGTVRVFAIVREDGTLDAPRVEDPWPAPALVYSALEALRAWEFRPARRGGVPIAVGYVLAVNFKLQ
jgi:TonB family protein